MKSRIILTFLMLATSLSLLSCIVTSRDINVDISCDEFRAHNHVRNDFQVEIGDWQSREPYQIKIFLQMVRRAMNGAARYKVMFASDWPVFRAIYDEKEWVEVLTKDCQQYGIEFTDEELNLVFCQNVQDYLDLDL